MKPDKSQALPAIDLLEQAVSLLRQAPINAWTAYVAGVLPWVIGLLYFWADMSVNPMAHGHASVCALALALAYVWMKTCQALFASHLTSRLNSLPAPTWTPRACLNLGLRQCAWQPTGLVVVPLCLLVTVPFPRIFAFYQNLTVLESPEAMPHNPLHKRAMERAGIWPAQNIRAILVLIALSLVVCLNLFIVLWFGPALLKMLTGIETVFTRSPQHAYWNSTFLMICLSLVYVVMDPLVKAVYVLRCFYGQSIHNGMDLHLNLRLCRAAMLCMILLCLSPWPVYGSESTVTPTQIDRSMDRVLSQPEYQWRIPRQETSNQVKSNWLTSFGDWIDRRLEALLSHEKDRERTPARRRPETNTALIKNVILCGLGILAILAIAILGLRHGWFKRHAPAQAQASPAIDPHPDLTQDDLLADQLPASGWLNLVDDLIKQGQFRLALRACFLALLAHYADCGHITIARFKTNLDYERELGRYAHAVPELMPSYRTLRRLFDATWYGHMDAHPELARTFREQVIQAMEVRV